MPRLGEGTSDAEHAVERLVGQVPALGGRPLSYAPATIPVASPMRRGVDGDGWFIAARDPDEQFFLKVPATDGIAYVDALASATASAIAAQTGVAPRLVWVDSVTGAAIWERLGEGWRTANLYDLADRAIMSAVLQAKRAIHRGPQFGRTRSIFDVAGSYAEAARAKAVPMPDDHGWMLGNLRLMETVIGAAGVDPVPCHGDGIASNVMVRTDKSVRLVDWDEATNADPWWDLGSLLTEAFAFDAPARAAFELYHGEFDVALFARCRLYGIADDFAWGTRSLIAAAETQRRDLEFFKYGQWRFLRCRMGMHDRRFEENLRAV